MLGHSCETHLHFLCVVRPTVHSRVCTSPDFPSLFQLTPSSSFPSGSRSSCRRFPVSSLTVVVQTVGCVGTTTHRTRLPSPYPFTPTRPLTGDPSPQSPGFVPSPCHVCLSSRLRTPRLVPLTVTSPVPLPRLCLRSNFSIDTSSSWCRLPLPPVL